MINSSKDVFFSVALAHIEDEWLICVKNANFFKCLLYYECRNAYLCNGLSKNQNVNSKTRKLKKRLI